MKAKTQIEQTVHAAYVAYADYARRVDNIPVVPSFPKVSWERGSLKNPNTGWVVDGTLYPGSAEAVMKHWRKVRAYWLKKMWKALGISPEQLPLPEGTDEPAGDGQ